MGLTGEDPTFLLDEGDPDTWDVDPDTWDDDPDTWDVDPDT